ncbi:MerR family transcriptional regulator [Hoyosella sp. G463]|uniref:MerR family transcriptional regulator n=1 Tax=Lolliginicoccus lacisalsi TaxID=2742202 RepID=A0A927JAY6_9ACTN|nr:MerR family transcriptional regulator [Lolliginicoccus lacisalsi]MBD8505958.1 MerR family transcriptional regulator [Lolliginicoccus lacisalsi]
MKEYRIDDLARAAGINVRNVRVYQDRGLLPPPRKEGRTGWYNESHLSRLRLITRMLERGYTFATISELLLASQHGISVDEILESDDLRGPLGFFRSKAKVTLAELRKVFGDHAPPTLLERGKELGVLSGNGEAFAVRSPRLLEIAQTLVDAGVPIETIVETGQRVRDDLQDVAQLFVGTITETFLPDMAGAGHGELDEQRIAELAEAARKLRPLANKVVDLLFSEVMEVEISRTISRAATALNDDGEEGEDPFAH